MELCNLILDLILVLVVVWGVISGWKRGFVRVVFTKMRWLTSIVIACLLAKPIGNLLKTKLFLAPMTVKIRDLLADTIGEGAVSASAEQLSENLPLVLRGILNLMGIDIADKAAEAEAAGGSLLDQFASVIAEPAARVVGIVVAFIGVFLICKFFLRIIVALIDAIFRLPGLHLVNTILGILFGAFFALAFAWVAVAALGYLGDLLTNGSIPFFNGFDIEKTWLAKYFYRFKPIDFIFSIK